MSRMEKAKDKVVGAIKHTYEALQDKPLPDMHPPETEITTLEMLKVYDGHRVKFNTSVELEGVVELEEGHCNILVKDGENVHKVTVTDEDFQAGRKFYPVREE